MKVKTWAAIAATTAGLGAAPAVAQEQQSGQGQGGQQGGNAQQQAAARAFIRASARSNRFEIESSTLVLEEARSVHTRRLARLLIRHHTEMQEELTEVAQPRTSRCRPA